MTKVKVTLSIEKVLVDMAKRQNVNLSQLLEYGIVSGKKVKKVITWEEEIEQY